jgi:transmembrane sensor
MNSPEELAPEDIAREAATWFARMRGPDAEARRGDFEAWLARGPEQRAAYNRAGEVFAMGKLLADKSRYALRRGRSTWRRPLAAATLCLLAAGFWFGVHDRAAAPTRAEIAQASRPDQFVTGPDETRLAQLTDGSSARLASNSRLLVQFGTARRVLVLQQGSARFDVHHETRPFIVRAGGGSVTARGTMFDVTLTRPGQVEVRLIRGVIDVQLPHQPTGRAAPVRRLVAGEQIAYLIPSSPEPVTSYPQAAQSLTASIDTDATARNFVSVPVATLIADANRSTSRPIRLADSALGNERVSGRLRIDDTERLAGRLSGLFGWSVDTRDPKEIVLRP